MITKHPHTQTHTIEKDVKNYIFHYRAEIETHFLNKA